MAEQDDKPTTSGPWAFASSRAGLIILVVIAAIIGLRLMSSWIKWMLIAVVVGAIVYLIKGALGRGPGEPGGE